MALYQLSQFELEIEFGAYPFLGVAIDTTLEDLTNLLANVETKSYSSAIDALFLLKLSE